MGKDILLDNGGDIFITNSGDITLENNIGQKVKILLQWFLSEWRFAPDLGLPYFEEVFVKNPNTTLITQIIREEAEKAEEVKEITDINIEIEKSARKAKISFKIVTDYEVFKEEIEIGV